MRTRQSEALTRAARRLYINHIAVHARARRAGVGTKLLAYAEAEARRLAASDIVLDAWVANEGAVAFFNARGYKPANIILAKPVTPQARINPT